MLTATKKTDDTNKPATTTETEETGDQVSAKGLSAGLLKAESAQRGGDAPVSNPLAPDEFERGSRQVWSARPRVRQIHQALVAYSAADVDHERMQALQAVKDAATPLLRGKAGSRAGKRWYQAVKAAQRAAASAHSRLVSKELAAGEKQFVDDSVATWDPEARDGKGDWVSSAEEGSETRNFAGIDSSRKAQRATLASVLAVKKISDIDELSLETVRNINPQSIVPYYILHDILHQNWHLAKEELATPRGGNVAVRQAMMRKLWEYRQWHHNVILDETKNKLQNGELDDWAAAGSTTLTSDIDVNLKGVNTEKAVKVFNDTFKDSTYLQNHRWSVEAGVAYDVNAYSVDFMHKFGGVGDQGKNATVQEGAREGRAQGGISNKQLRKQDQRNQSVAALLKVRIYMTATQWEAYKKKIRLGPDERAGQESIWKQVEAEYDTYMKTMSQAMLNDGNKVVEEADAATNTGVQILEQRAAALAGNSGNAHVDDTNQQQLMIGTANRVYEQKITVIKQKRDALREKLSLYDAMSKQENAAPDQVRNLNNDIERRLLELRKLIAESAFYANEASITDATVHHGVVGLQGGRQIDQTKAQGMNAVNEHMADSLKEIARHGHGGDQEHFGEALFKAGKYFYRLGDAAKNMGFGYIYSVQKLYEAGDRISVTIKKSGKDEEAKSKIALAEIFSQDLRISDTGQLAQTIIDAATDVANEYYAECEALAQHTEGEDNAEIYGHTTQKKGGKNPHSENIDMVHPIDRDKDHEPPTQMG